jgi:hypothetical protein
MVSGIGHALADELGALALGEAREVRDVQRQRDPVADVRRQPGAKSAQKLWSSLMSCDEAEKTLPIPSPR